MQRTGEEKKFPSTGNSMNKVNNVGRSLEELKKWPVSQVGLLQKPFLSKDLSARSSLRGGGMSQEALGGE